MQAAKRSGGVVTVYRRPESEEEQRAPAADDEEDETAALPDPPAASSSASLLSDPVTRALQAAARSLGRNAAGVTAALAGVGAACLAVATLLRRSRRTRHRGRSSSSNNRLPGQPTALDAPADGVATPDAASAGDAAGAVKTAGLPNGAARPRRPRKAAAAAATAAPPPPPGPLSKLRPTSSCVALADGSACVVRRKIAADNSCLFNAVGYCMHHSHNRAPFLRSVVAREVSSDPQEYSDVFLGMPNASYCAWIVNPVNWGGGIELAILAAHYRREVAAWNIESGRRLVFGEEKDFKKQVMVIYTGTHYDALAVAANPRAPQDDDVTEFNPRTKRGKMILAAAQKLTELNNPMLAAASKAAAAAPRVPAGARLLCDECGTQLDGVAEAQAHAKASGHAKFSQAAAASAGPGG